MIEVARLVQQENICKPKTKKRSADPIEKADGNKQCQKGERLDMEKHSLARPGPDPIKPVISEMKHWFNIEGIDPVTTEIMLHFPNHQRAKYDSEETDGSDIDGGEKIFQKFQVGHRIENRGKVSRDRWLILHLNVE